MSEALKHTGIPYLKILQYTVFGSVILYFGRDLLIPLSFAALISCILYPVASWMERKGANRLTATIISVTLLCLLILGVVVLLINQFISFLKEWPLVQQKLSLAFKELSEFFITRYGVTKQEQGEWLTQLSNQSVGMIISVARETIRSSAFSAVLVILVPVFAILMLYHRSVWIQVFYQIFPHEKKEDIRDMMLLTIKAYYNFIKGMALVYLIVGILNSVGLLLLGIPHAILFGFIAAILTFIPYIGIMVGSLLPITMAWITYDSVWYPLGVVGVFTLVQYLEANVIFPLTVSNRLQVNTLIVLAAIILGGILWGVAGMILFIPFVAIIKLIADHNPNLKTLSMILGTKQKEKAQQKNETE